MRKPDVHTNVRSHPPATGMMGPCGREEGNLRDLGPDQVGGRGERHRATRTAKDTFWKDSVSEPKQV